MLGGENETPLALGAGDGEGNPYLNALLIEKRVYLIYSLYFFKMTRLFRFGFTNYFILTIHLKKMKHT